MIETPEQAQACAENLLAVALPNRWRHTQAVAGKAALWGRALLPEAEAALLASAGWLHDVGYAPVLCQTGFHPLDGARWLLENGASPRLAALVAHHSCSAFEADLRGLSGALASFPREETLLADLLTLADMTTGPLGEPLTVDARLADIKDRYGPDHLVTRFISRAEGDLRAAAQRAGARLVVAGLQGQTP